MARRSRITSIQRTATDSAVVNFDIYETTTGEVQDSRRSMVIRYVDGETYTEFRQRVLAEYQAEIDRILVQAARIDAKWDQFVTDAVGYEYP